MDKLQPYFSSLDVEGKSEDEIFRLLCIDKEYKKLDDVTWVEAFVNRFGKMMSEIPNPRIITARIVNRGLKEMRLSEIDCENTYFNKFGGWRVDMRYYLHYCYDLGESYRVTDACLMNIFLEQYDDWENLKHFRGNGIYSVGKEGAHYPSEDYEGKTLIWGPKEQVCESRVIADIIYKYSIWDEYKADFDAFWEANSDLYADMLADTFLANAVRQYKRKALSEEGFQMVLAAYYGSTDKVKVSLLDIYGYASTDIICIEYKEVPVPRVVLFISGGTNPFMEFYNLDDLKLWISEQLKEENNLIALRKHFSLKLRQDGTSFTGVDTILKAMAEDSESWPAQTYILYNPVHLTTEQLFPLIRDRTKQRMLDDSDVQIKSNSEATRDYALHLLETFISQLAVIDMIVPEIGIPLNLALSSTMLGLSSDIVVNGDTLNERKYGVGQLINSALFTALNLIPVLQESATVLRNFARAAEDIPAFLTEEQYIANHFGCTKEDLSAISPGDTPRVPVGENPKQMRLVRLANENAPLIIIRRVGGNLYARLNPFTLEEMEEGFISEILNPATEKYYYVTKSNLLGGSPLTPFPVSLDEIWTVSTLRKKAYVLGKPIGTSYSRIQDTLAAIHESADLNIRQRLIHELIELIDDYKTVHPGSERLPAFLELQQNLIDSLYPPHLNILSGVKEHLLALPNRGSGAANFLLNRSINEIAGSNEETVAHLIRYAQHDPLISAPFNGVIKHIPAEINYQVNYVIRNIDMFDALSTNYFELPAYAELGITKNSVLIKHVLQESKNMNQLIRCSVIDDTLYIGHTYEELYHSISEFANGAEGTYPVHPKTFFNMLQEAHTGFDFTQFYATRDFFRRTVTNRLSEMENIIMLSDGYDYTNWDVSFGDAFRTNFTEAEDTTARISLCLSNNPGVIMNDTSQSIDLFINNLPDFISNGLTDIAITDLHYDLVQADIMRFLNGEEGWQQLDAMLLNLDKGEVQGSFRRLLQAAKENNVRFTAIGHADQSISPYDKAYQFAYFKGNTILRGIETLMDDGKKFVVFADSRLINTTQGAKVPLPGLAQYLKSPGTTVDLESNWTFLSDAVENRVAISTEELTNWKPLAPSHGKFFGFGRYRMLPEERPTQEMRNVILENSVSEEQREGLMQTIDQIKNDELIQSFISSDMGTCDTMAVQVRRRLIDMGLEAGSGASITGWEPNGSYKMHTTTTFRYAGNEFVVDTTHFQFLHNESDSSILFSTIENWGEEIARRMLVLHPFISHRLKTGNSLALFTPPEWSKPILKRGQTSVD